MNLEQQYQTALLETARALPHNTISGMLWHAHSEHDERFGGSCVAQCVELRRRLRQIVGAELAAGFYSGNGLHEGHIVVMTEDAEHGRHLMDPFLFQCEPLPLRAVKDGRTAYARCLSSNPAAYRTVEMREASHGTLRHRQSHVRFSYVTDPRVSVVLPNTPDPIDRETALYKQEELSMYIVNSEYRKLIIDVMTHGDHFAVAIKTAGQTVWNTYGAAFDDLLDHAASQIRVTGRELLEYLRHGWEVHRRLHPEEDEISILHQ